MPRKKAENNREKYTTLIDAELLKKAKLKAIEEGYEGANSIIEKALEMYTSSNIGTLWQKEIESGWIDTVRVDKNEAIYITARPEYIRRHKLIGLEAKTRFSEKELELRGYKKIGYIRLI